MAGCARSGSRQLVALALLLVAQAAAAQPAPAQRPAQPRDAQAAPATASAATRGAARASPSAQHPDAALLEYLGEFDDAADGLDAMGLEESTQGNGKDSDGKNNGGRR